MKINRQRIWTVILSALLVLTALLCVLMTLQRGNLRNRSAQIVASTESAEAEWRAIDHDKTQVWQARRREAEEAADELKAQLDDSGKSIARTRDQVKEMENRFIREVRARLGAAMLNNAAAFLEHQAAGSGEAAE